MSRDNYPFHRESNNPTAPRHVVNGQPNHYGCDPYNTADARELRQRLYTRERNAPSCNWFPGSICVHPECV